MANQYTKRKEQQAAPFNPAQHAHEQAQAEQAPIIEAHQGANLPPAGEPAKPDERPAAEVIAQKAAKIKPALPEVPPAEEQADNEPPLLKRIFAALDEVQTLVNEVDVDERPGLRLHTGEAHRNLKLVGMWMQQALRPDVRF